MTKYEVPTVIFLLIVGKHAREHTILSIQQNHTTVLSIFIRNTHWQLLIERKEHNRFNRRQSKDGQQNETGIHMKT